MTVTPSPLSVVVPGSAWERFLYRSDFLRGAAVVDGHDVSLRSFASLVEELKAAAAPAPSSLAGGEVERLSKVYAEATGYYVKFHRGLSSPSADSIRTGVRAVLAALSPEAPAREVSYQDLLDAGVSECTIEDKTGEGWGLKDIAEEHCPELLAGAVPEPTDIRGVLTFYADGFDWHPGDGEAPDATHPGSAPTFYEASARDALLEDGGHLARQALAALTPRHEAPAEGAGEREEIARIVEPSAFVEETTDHSRVYRNLSLQEGRAEAFTKAEKILPLRAHSSAPEAREGEAVESERVRALANLFSIPDGGRYLNDWKIRAGEYNAWRTASVAPSADKLRTALSEIRDGMVASRDCISVDDWIELADEALKGDAKS